MQRITAATCPEGRSHVLLWDAVQPGLCVRVYPSGRRTFLALYRAGKGRSAPKRWLTLGEVGAVSLADARKAASVHLGAVARGDDPAAERREVRRRQRALLESALERYGRDLERRQVVKRKEVLSLLRRELAGPFG